MPDDGVPNALTLSPTLSPNAAASQGVDSEDRVNGRRHEEEAAGADDADEAVEDEDSEGDVAIRRLRRPARPLPRPRPRVEDPHDPAFDPNFFDGCVSFEEATTWWIEGFRTPPSWNAWQKGATLIAKRRMDTDIALMDIWGIMSRRKQYI